MMFSGYSRYGFFKSGMVQVLPFKKWINHFWKEWDMMQKDE